MTYTLNMKCVIRGVLLRSSSRRPSTCATRETGQTLHPVQSNSIYRSDQTWKQPSCAVTRRSTILTQYLTCQEVLARQQCRTPCRKKQRQNHQARQRNRTSGAWKCAQSRTQALRKKTLQLDDPKEKKRTLTCSLCFMGVILLLIVIYHPLLSKKGGM